MTLPTSALAIVSLGSGALAAIILVAYLIRRPPLVRITKIALLLGLGIFPIVAAGAGNVQGFEATTKRQFCGSCHVMKLHAEDSDDPTSQTLAARHGRNAMFGGENCYTCHADYGMFGTLLTKMGGMRHVWLYYTEYRNTTLEEAKQTIKLRAPYPNSNCMQCHTTTDKLWLQVSDHEGVLADARADRVSCASPGCHGLAHPFFQPKGATQ